MNLSLDQDYWSARYKENQTGWDLGEASTPIKQFLDQVTDKNIKILIPGAGNAYEAAYAYNMGFKNVYVLDFALLPLDNFKRTYPNFPMNQLYCEDFFDHEGSYDLIIEQTFFCALNPSLRSMYAEKMAKLLKDGGVLAGVLFNKNFTHVGPPFGGSKDEYIGYFEPFFDIQIMESCYNSILPRQESELFIKLVK
ncbi:TPMT family class I SAM-dependent methyltransferase [Belliella kenyensis]|uniref:TPMT family class I SAM-dependent methyltransferase n=1 Tax=Belliella kenyensis TaxID=1472724 RepID=A0ABV8EF56_9BACT|nr:TPMT family class I SAM-dependent methyltransferase [Belliella kenyensis]MCH7401773.1 TPMT family class I SAM-dependent methyltransferase [Belliella kenyensis]MDN3604272.1 TPMT family class I SAM-dependent methyltransferase [Belliella kenyensis]